MRAGMIAWILPNRQVTKNLFSRKLVFTKIIELVTHFVFRLLTAYTPQLPSLITPAESLVAVADFLAIVTDTIQSVNLHFITGGTMIEAYTDIKYKLRHLNVGAILYS